MGNRVKLFCTKCKRKTDNGTLGSDYSKNKHLMLKGTCSVCNTKKQQFCTQEQAETALKEHGENVCDSDEEVDEH